MMYIMITFFQSVISLEFGINRLIITLKLDLFINGFIKLSSGKRQALILL